MVGKGSEQKSSRIFQQCYLKCCKLQNLTPITGIVPTGNGKVLDFCVDRIKYVEWPPILNALSYDLSLHSVAIRCRQQVKTVLEQIDCERLAKTVNKRCVMLTKFMLSNLVEALSQLLGNTTLLLSLTLEGLPLRIPYLNPLCEAIAASTSLQHLHLPRCLVGDAGCLALCKAVRGLPNILTLDLSGCELTPLGACYIADLVKYQKIHRYSENWIHTLRYRLPELDTMAGLRRISVCANPLGHEGALKLLEVLADDLWIKAVDMQSCNLTEETAEAALHTLSSNSTLVVLDLRHNDISTDSLSAVRAALRRDRSAAAGQVQQFSWLASGSGSSSEKLVKPAAPKNGLKERERTMMNLKNPPPKYPAKTANVKKEKDYAEVLEEQLQEEIVHRQELEELNLQLINQMKQLKQHQIQLWASSATSCGSEHSLQASSRSGDHSSSSGSSTSVPIDQNTLAYIQQAFKDIYSFIKNNQCTGECGLTKDNNPPVERESSRYVKRAQSSHAPPLVAPRAHPATQSAHQLAKAERHPATHTKEMFEKNIGDTRTAHDDSGILEDMVASQLKPNKNGWETTATPRSGSDSDTLVNSPQRQRRHSRQYSPENSPEYSPKYSQEHSPKYSQEHSAKYSQEHSAKYSQEHSPKYSQEHSPNYLQEHSPKYSQSPQYSPNYSHAVHPRHALFSSSDEDSS